MGIRIFKGINKFKVYHFGSIVLRKRLNKIKLNNRYGSRGAKLFLLKWGISIKFFKKYYLKSNLKFEGPLKDPNKNLKFIFNYIICKIKYLYVRLLYNKLYSKN